MVKLSNAFANKMPLNELWAELARLTSHINQDNQLSCDDEYPIDVRKRQMVSISQLIQEIERHHTIPKKPVYYTLLYSFGLDSVTIDAVSNDPTHLKRFVQSVYGINDLTWVADEGGVLTASFNINGVNRQYQIKPVEYV